MQEITGMQGHCIVTSFKLALARNRIVIIHAASLLQLDDGTAMGLCRGYLFPDAKQLTVWRI